MALHDHLADRADQHGPKPPKEQCAGQAAQGGIEKYAVSAMTGEVARRGGDEKSGAAAEEEHKPHVPPPLSSSGSVRRTIAPGTSSSQSPVNEGPVARKSGSIASSNR
jgi:hypothetical protein